MLSSSSCCCLAFNRSLQVANPVVRAQATGLLVDAFPLQNPDAGTIEVGR